MNLIIHPERAQERTPYKVFHQWTLSDDTPWLLFHRAPDGYFLRFPELADFLVQHGASDVHCTPAPSIPRDTWEHLYLNQVLPLAENLRGNMVFHAATVEIDGGAIAFAGVSGRGKSTLSASFAVNGSRFLSDDGLLLKDENGEFFATPSHSSVRLWKDSEMALISPGAPVAPALPYTDKSRFLATVALPHCDQPRRLLVAYMLGEGTTAEVSITPIGRSQSAIEWVKHSFLIDVEDRRLLQSHLDRVARLADAVPVFMLDYPRDYERLPDVRARIAEHVERIKWPS